MRHQIKPLQREQLDRLPKYAQDHVRDLERRVAQLEADLGVAQQTIEPGRILAREDVGGVPILIPDHYDVEFDLGGQPGGGHEISRSAELSLSIRNTAGVVGKDDASGARYLQVMASCATLLAVHTSSNVIALVPGYGAHEALLEAGSFTRGVEFITQRRKRLGLNA